MKIVSDIIDAYLNNVPLQNYKSHWIFEEIGRGELKGKNAFYEPSYEQAFRESVSIKLRDTFDETNEEKQSKYLYDAIFGNYYDKFACMAGMLYLANVWAKGGIPALTREFSKSYKGF